MTLRGTQSSPIEWWRYREEMYTIGALFETACVTTCIGCYRLYPHDGANNPACIVMCVFFVSYVTGFQLHTCSHYRWIWFPQSGYQKEGNNLNTWLGCLSSVAESPEAPGKRRWGGSTGHEARIE